MPAFKHVCEASICLSEGKDVDIHHLLGIFAGTLALAQKRLDRRQLNLAQQMLDSTQAGLLGQLFGLSIFSRYKIAEMTVEFFVISEESGAGPRAPVRFRLAHKQAEHERIHQASIRVHEADQKLAEFRVEGKLISMMAIH